MTHEQELKTVTEQRDAIKKRIDTMEKARKHSRAAVLYYENRQYYSDLNLLNILNKRIEHLLALNNS
jgi:hypothetical protein